MAVLVAFLVLFLAMAGHSNAAYCICKDGVSDQVLQKNIDYACGAGADCTPIHDNAPCFNPNTVKDHCNWAVNSYYQRKGQAVGSCDFAGTAIVSQTAPTTSSGCVYPSSPSNAGSTTTTPPSTNPTTSPPTGGTGTGTNPITSPPTGGTGNGTNPITTPPGGTNPINTPPGGINPITTPPGSNTGTSFGPSGSGSFNPDGSGSGAPAIRLDSYLLVATVLLSGLIWLRF